MDFDSKKKELTEQLIEKLEQLTPRSTKENEKIIEQFEQKLEQLRSTKENENIIEHIEQKLEQLRSTKENENIIYTMGGSLGDYRIESSENLIYLLGRSLRSLKNRIIFGAIENAAEHVIQPIWIGSRELGALIENENRNPIGENAEHQRSNRFNKLIHNTFNIILEWKIQKISEQIHGAQEFSEVTINSLLDLIKYLKYFNNLKDQDQLKLLYKLNKEELEKKLKEIRVILEQPTQDKQELKQSEQESEQPTQDKQELKQPEQESEQPTQDEQELKQLEQESKQPNQDEQELNQLGKELKQLIKIVFILSLKKEESRYPRFQLYIPLGESNSKNSDALQDKYLIKFDQQKTPTTIDLDNLDSVARLSLGIPYKNCALLVKKREHESILILEGIIRIEKPNLAGILLHVDAPGKLSITYTYSLKKETQEELVQVKLALVESKIRKYSDPVENPMVDIFAFKLAQNICNNNNINPTKNKEFQNKIDALKEKKKFYKNIFPAIISIVKRIFNDILKSAVDFGHGSQFVILTDDEEDYNKEDYTSYLNIRYCVVQEQYLQENFQEFLEKYVDFLSEFEDENGEHPLKYEKLLISYDKLFISYDKLLGSYKKLLKSVEKYTESIAYLSTIDGSIILNGNLSLIGFGGQTISNYDEGDDEYFPIEIESTYNGEEDSPSLNIWDKTEEISKFYSKYFKRGTKKWEFKKFGARHQSAARLCKRATKLDPFIFVVSQTGDIREFMNIEHEDEGQKQKYVGVLGPLRPL